MVGALKVVWFFVFFAVHRSVKSLWLLFDLFAPLYTLHGRLLLYIMVFLKEETIEAQGLGHLFF